MKNSNEKQFFLKSLLVIQTFAVMLYTAFALNNEGSSLFQIFVGNISALNWNGQFNLDFSCFLTLSGVWIMWRNKMSYTSIAIAVVAMIIGIMVFAPYVFYLLTIEKGNIKKVLVGERLN